MLKTYVKMRCDLRITVVPKKKKKKSVIFTLSVTHFGDSLNIKP